MPRFILIDRNSGFIWGDTGDLDGPAREETPAQAAERLDAHTGERPDPEEAFEYVETYRADADATYDVYRADVGGSEAVPIVVDGTDQETIDAVQRDCEFVCSIRRDVVPNADA